MWWPVPARPTTWFSEEELAHSHGYQRPLARAKGLGVVASLLAIGVMQAWLWWGSVPGWMGGSRGWPTIGAALAVVWVLQSVARQLWVERVHEPRLGRRGPVTVEPATVLLALAVGALSGGVAAGFYGATSILRSPVVLGVVGAAAFIAASLVAVLEQRRHLTSGESLGGADDWLVLDWKNLATGAGVGGVEFLRGPVEVEQNAASLPAIGGPPLVAVGPTLLEEESALVQFVVAHEVGHLARRHHWWSAAAHAVLVGGALATAGWMLRLVDGSWPEASDSPLSLPASLAVLLAVATPFSAAVAWVARIQERVADRWAARHVAVPPLPSLRRLLVTEGADLAPGLVARTMAHHPPPAERLTRLIGRS